MQQEEKAVFIFKKCSYEELQQYNTEKICY